jgi:hypothetical protein
MTWASRSACLPGREMVRGAQPLYRDGSGRDAGHTSNQLTSGKGETDDSDA